MTLPQIQSPTFSIHLPVSKIDIEFRPFQVREEKILLMAMESKESSEIIRAITNVLNNCIMNDDIRVENLPAFEVEYLFLNLRAKSVGEIIELKLMHPDGKNQAGVDCNHIQEVNINIDDINIDVPENHSNQIMIDEESDLGVVMKYPTLNFALDNIANLDEENADDIFKLITLSIKTIFHGDDVFDASEHTPEDLTRFVENLSHKQFEKISEFFKTIPKLYHEIKYKCDGCGEEQTYTIEGLENFF